MENYINKLLEQVRFTKAHKMIADEIRSHMEDQIKANISEGMDPEAAEKRAVEDMGDPVEAGVSLDRVHRPQIAWGVIIAAVVIAIIAIIVHIYISNEVITGYKISTSGGRLVSEGTLFAVHTIEGIVVMLLLYLVDYTTIAKYSKLVATVLLGANFVSSYAYFTMRAINGVPGMGEAGFFYLLCARMYGYASSLIVLMIPLFAGILYKYKGQKTGALVKSLLWIFATAVCMSYKIGIGWEHSSTVVMVFCMLIELTVAIKKEWIKVPKILAIASAWSLFTIIPVAITGLLYKNRMLEYGHMERIRSFFIPNTEMNRIKEINSGLVLIGSGSVSSFGGKVNVSTKNLLGKIPWITHEYILTGIGATLGIAVVLAVVIAVAGLIVLGIISSCKSKNQLGQVMGNGCMMWLALYAVVNICVGFGILSPYFGSFFPFLSYNRLSASYAFLGIILSIYKYKNAYPAHVDIGILKKKKELDKECV